MSAELLHMLNDHDLLQEALNEIKFVTGEELYGGAL